MKFIDDWLKRPYTPPAALVFTGVINSIGIAIALAIAIRALWFL